MFYYEPTDFLKNLSELTFDSNMDSKVFYQLSQICHKIQITIKTLGDVVSNGLSDLISVQQNLKYLDIWTEKIWSERFISLLTKNSNTLIKSEIIIGVFDIPLSFISKFTYLQELAISFDYLTNFKISTSLSKS